MSNPDIIVKILDHEVSFYTDVDNPLSVYVEYHGVNDSLHFEPVDSLSFQSFLAFRYHILSEEPTTPDFSPFLNLNIHCKIPARQSCKNSKAFGWQSTARYHLLFS